MSSESRSAHIVVLDGYTLNPGDNPWDALAELGPTQVYHRTEPDQVIARAQHAQVLVINKIRLSAETLDQLPNLRFVTVTATGYDCVDVRAAEERGIVVSNVPVYGTDSVAQYVFAMLLFICHRIDLHDQAIRQGQWEASGDFSFWKVSLCELVGKKMGIVGFGRIGRRVGQLANAFAMQVLACDQVHTNRPAYEPFSWASLEELFDQCDVISLHCPLTDETRGMINRQMLQRARSNLILINAARGGLIIEDDLAEALNSQWIAAAGLDVVSSEPISSDNPLLSARNCFLTPHYAWATLEARRRLMDVTVQNVAAFLAGKPENVVT